MARARGLRTRQAAKGDWMTGDQRVLDAEWDAGDMDDWWAGIDEDVRKCLMDRAPLTPVEIGRRLGISEGAATSLLCMLASAGKVRICLVELSDETSGTSGSRGSSARATTAQSARQPFGSRSVPGASRLRARGSAPDAPDERRRRAIRIIAP